MSKCVELGFDECVNCIRNARMSLEIQRRYCWVSFVEQIAKLPDEDFKHRLCSPFGGSFTSELNDVWQRYVMTVLEKLYPERHQMAQKLMVLM